MLTLSYFRKRFSTGWKVFDMVLIDSLGASNCIGHHQAALVKLCDVIVRKFLK